MKVQPPSPALMAGFKKIGEQLTADWLAKAGADGKAVVDAYKKAAATNEPLAQALSNGRGGEPPHRVTGVWNRTVAKTCPAVLTARRARPKYRPSTPPLTRDGAKRFLGIAGP